MEGFYAKMTEILLGNGRLKMDCHQEIIFSYRKSPEELDWLLFCYEQLKDEIPLSPPSLENSTYVTYAEKAPLLQQLYETWYENDTKMIPLHFLEQFLTAESLAWWYQDQGHLKKKKNGTLEKIILSTEKWTDEEHALLQYVLNLKFGLLFAIDGQKRLILYEKLSINYFLSLVTPWMQPIMVRKMKTVSVMKPIAKRTSIRLDSPLTFNSPTREINDVIAKHSHKIKMTNENFKRWNYKRTEENDISFYQIALTDDNRQQLSVLQSTTGLTMNEIVQECFYQDAKLTPPLLKTLDDLTTTQQNVILGSILGDGMLTHYPTKHNGLSSSYYEHFSIEQQAYRAWKVMKLEPYLYFIQRSVVIASKIAPLWSTLHKFFYYKLAHRSSRTKQMPNELLAHLTDIHGLLTLYLDDGSLMLSHRVNHRSKKIYIAPHIALYLQNFTYDELRSLSDHLNQTFSIHLSLTKTPSGHGYCLRTFKIKDTLTFLEKISSAAITCPSMSYKTNWAYRFYVEKQHFLEKYPDYEVSTSSSDRFLPYSEQEINQLMEMKQNHFTDQEIADAIGRSYWSTVYKIRDLREKGILR